MPEATYTYLPIFFSKLKFWEEGLLDHLFTNTWENLSFLSCGPLA